VTVLPPEPLGLHRFVPGRAQSEVHSVDLSGLDAGSDPAVVDGERTVVWIETEPTEPGDDISMSSATALQIEAGVNAALAQRIPLVITMSTSGTDILEGMPALAGWGRVARALTRCSGTVPTIIVVDGPIVSGPALLCGVVDVVVMTEGSSAFVNGPVMVEQFTGVAIDVDELGGVANHRRYTGVASAVLTDRKEAHEWVRDLLAYLPTSVDVEPPRWPLEDPADRLCPEAGSRVPPSSTGSYDVRDIAADVADNGSLLELRDHWAPNVVTALAAIDGRPVGIVANQPMSLAGTLDIPASQKAARFVSWCDAFNLPIITLVDTPGFYPGKDLEWRGMIRHGAQLVFAYGQATVPRICVILRKSYGGAYIVMDSKTMGNDLCLAWPWAEIAVMGAGQAAAILARRATDEERAEFERDYAERLLNPYVAAERGFIDAVIDPADTRSEIAAALDLLANKRESLTKRKHGNIPQ